MLEAIASHASVAKYIDMPLQHASASVLKRMKRGASSDIFLKLLDKMRKTIPGVTLRTSFIVGFPGETERDFEELCQFVEAAQFDRVGVFEYSDEDTSQSYHLDGKVDPKTIRARKRKLMSVQKKISKKRNKALVGSEFTVLVDGPSEETDMLWQARGQSQAPEIDGVCYINDFGEVAPTPGQMRRFRVTEAHDYDLVGELVDTVTEPARPVARALFPILTARPEATLSR